MPQEFCLSAQRDGLLGAKRYGQHFAELLKSPKPVGMGIGKLQ